MIDLRFCWENLSKMSEMYLLCMLLDYSFVTRIQASSDRFSIVWWRRESLCKVWIEWVWFVDNKKDDVRIRSILAVLALHWKKETWKKIGVGQASMTSSTINDEKILASSLFIERWLWYRDVCYCSKFVGWLFIPKYIEGL